MTNENRLGIRVSDPAPISNVWNSWVAEEAAGVMVPPRNQEELSDWHYRLNMRFELGTLYTMIAGLLNVLAIWDAYGGPVLSEPGKPERHRH